jgi:hypothetical protein
MSKERPWEAGPFEQWVIDELDYRKNSLSTGIQGQFKGDLPQYAGPRKAWARVFSNGMVEYPNGNANLISDNDNEWGLAFASGDGFFNRYGIDGKTPYGVSKQVYGYNCKLQPKYIDASTRPNIPDPGIISIETEIQKSWFAKAKINWTCHSIEQLKAITPYFLTPLQSVIIEFGWNTFDQRSLINLSNFGEILDIWDNHYKRYSEYVPKSKGNYEFMIGQIVNFEYTINDNIITGMTEVASRQLLYSGFKKDPQENLVKGKTIGKDGKPSDETVFRTKYETLVDTTVNSITSTNNQGGFSLSQPFIDILQSNSGYAKKYGADFKNLSDHIFSGRNKQTITYSAERDFDVDNEKGPTWTWLTMDLLVDILNGIKNVDGVKEYTQYFFDLNIDDITIGAHDNLISTKKTVLIPNPAAPKLNSNKNNYLNALGEDAYTDTKKHKFFKPTYPNAHSNISPYKETNYSDKIFRRTSGAVSEIHRQDLNYILNNWGRTNSRQNTAIPTEDPTFGGTRVPDNLKRGYLKSIYINLEFLQGVLKDPNCKNLKEVYERICKEINEASCNFWELTVVDAPVVNGKSTLKIVDEKGPPNTGFDYPIYKFEYMTNNSIIKKLNFTTNLSNAQANQIIFKAGSYDYITSNQMLDYNNNLNASNSNKPAVVYNDRILKSKAQPTTVVPPKSTGTSTSLGLEAINYFYKLIGKDGKKSGKDESVQFLQVTLFGEKPGFKQNFQQNPADGLFVQIYKGWENIAQDLASAVTAPTSTVDYDTYDIVDIIMPFQELVLYMLNDGDVEKNTNIYNAPLRNVEIELSLMGISGIKTFEFFRITNLPPPFNDDVVVFQVTNVTHVINENTWETRLKAQLRPAYNLKGK